MNDSIIDPIASGTKVTITSNLDDNIRLSTKVRNLSKDNLKLYVDSCKNKNGKEIFLPPNILYNFTYTSETGNTIHYSDVSVTNNISEHSYIITLIHMLTLKQQRKEIRLPFFAKCTCKFVSNKKSYPARIHDLSLSGVGVHIILKKGDKIKVPDGAFIYFTTDTYTPFWLHVETRHVEYDEYEEVHHIGFTILRASEAYAEFINNMLIK